MSENKFQLFVVARDFSIIHVYAFKQNDQEGKDNDNFCDPMAMTSWSYSRTVSVDRYWQQTA